MRKLDRIELTIAECKIKVRFKDYDFIRELAKTGEMRMAWSVAQTSRVPLFEGSVLDWTPLQKRLVYWLSFYTNVLGAYERPPSRVINNNKLLDKWLDSKSEEAEEEAEKNWSKSNGKVAKTAYDHDEVYTFDQQG